MVTPMERLAKRRERERQETRGGRYAVVYDHPTLSRAVFGYSDSQDGGLAMRIARLVSWAKNPRSVLVIAKYEWDRTHSAEMPNGKRRPGVRATLREI